MVWYCQHWDQTRHGAFSSQQQSTVYVWGLRLLLLPVCELLNNVLFGSNRSEMWLKLLQWLMLGTWFSKLSAMWVLKLHTERPEPGFEPRTFLLWGDCTTVPALSKSVYRKQYAFDFNVAPVLIIKCMYSPQVTALIHVDIISSYKAELCAAVF